MIAPKRSVMIDDPARAITDIADPASEAPAHPSQAAGAGRVQRRRTPARGIRGHNSVTCSACRITYLPSALLPTSEDRVCDNCQQILG